MDSTPGAQLRAERVIVNPPGARKLVLTSPKWELGCGGGWVGGEEFLFLKENDRNMRHLRVPMVLLGPL